LTVHSREKLLDDYQAGTPVRLLAQQLGVSRKTCYGWLRRGRVFGRAGLRNRSSRPHALRYRVSAAQAAALLTLRQERRWGPLRLAQQCGLASATVYRTLRRAKLHRLRSPRPPVVRYEAARPGALVHLDVLHLAARRPAGQYQFTVIDDYTRPAWASLAPQRSAVAAVQVLREAQAHFGYPFEAVLTDNDATFTVAALPQTWHGATAPVSRFTKACAALGIQHRLTRVRRPQTNGKVERLHRTMREECWRPFAQRCGVVLEDVAHQPKAIQRQRQAALAQPLPWTDTLTAYLSYYNGQRKHTALQGLTPDQRKHAYFAQGVLPTS
jgi:transposase InsO family protein